MRTLPLLLLCAALAGSQPDASSTEAQARRIFAGVNEQRRAARLPPLRWDERLAALARTHSGRMAHKRFFSHTDPERGDMQRRLREAGIDYVASGENIYTSYRKPDPARAAVLQWMDSKAHRANLLEAQFTHTGVGAALSKDGHFYATEIFAAY